MYKLTTNSEFDSAHFLKGYDGKCANIHGHRWNIQIVIKGENVIGEGPERGMLVDFSTLKEDLKEITGNLDHSLIIEEGTLKEKTLEALSEEGFRVICFPFRPTAENFAKFFYDAMKKKGYRVDRAICYETPNNCVEYSEE